MNTIKIIPNPKGRFYDVFLGNMNISDFVRGVNISISAGNVPQVHILIAAAKVEIPDELSALIIAKKDEEE